ncbi:MAG: hypothetical protein CMG74_04275 [Candidatus Marinimicrobia bacterium]|nr:hypothetical protein [Candidatus Neomarinimicrobiota bacterium]|tara:strand:- start:9906 stop:10823 length:918 start_codon:yes stop_codon:yes gene_type:complete
MSSNSYDYRVERFKTIKNAWRLNSLHELLVFYSPQKNDLNELRFALMLYISKALYFDFTSNEEEFIHRLDGNYKRLDNVTPNGGIVPKKEYQLEYNLVLRSWSKIVKNMVENNPSLITKYRITPNIRVKFAQEIEENINRTLNTAWPHSDAWVEGPWSMNCYFPAFGDIENNNLRFWTLKDNNEFSKRFLDNASTYEEMQWVLDYYQINKKLKPIKNKVHLSDYALIHATHREEGCGTRVSIDTTVCVGDHDVHADREKEYLKEVSIIGEDYLISSNRSIDDNILDKKSLYSHYTTGSLKVHKCK